MITQTELQKLLQSTETYRVERTTSTGVPEDIDQDYHFPDARKVIEVCSNAEHKLANRFPDVRKTIPMPKGTVAVALGKIRGRTRRSAPTTAPTVHLKRK